MADIHVLDKSTIDQIAAGEVVERPASVVKELVENAIDAHANAITVEIRAGGCDLIRVTDNGEGIESSQIENAFARHATSKIFQAQDLLSVDTLGFRGEALSSISAVSRVELITKTANALVGVRALLEGGRDFTSQEVGAPSGTTFIIRDLFFNTPARKKFLKTPTTEAGYVSDLIEHLAISRPEISFKFINNGQTKLHTSGNNNLKDIIYSIYGREAAASLIPVEYQEEGFSVRGFIGKPSFSRGNRNYENHFINGRFVRDKIISRATEDAFGPYLIQHRYPFTALLLAMDTASVDVNVHPAKQEVRFSDPQRVYDTLRRVLSQALSSKELIPEETPMSRREIQIEAKKEKASALEAAGSVPEPFEKMRRSFFASGATPYRPQYSGSPFERRPRAGGEVSPFSGDGSGDGMRSAKSDPMADLKSQDTAKMAAVPAHAAAGRVAEDTGYAKETSAVQMDLFADGFLTKEHEMEHKIIGQLFNTYWLVEFRDHLYLIDQHAAHEKVLYERLRKRMKESTITSQQVSPPLIVTLTISEAHILEEYMPLFEKSGFEITHFGGREYAISAVPENLYGHTQELFFTQMLDTLSESNGEPSEELMLAKLASMACKAAVKGRSALSSAEAKALIDELLTLENPYHCPHGRPTIITMSRYEIEKKFKRIVS